MRPESPEEDLGTARPLGIDELVELHGLLRSSGFVVLTMEAKTWSVDDKLLILQWSYERL